MRPRLALPIAIFSLLALVSCGPSNLGSGNGNDDADSPPAAADSGGTAGNECEATPQCDGELVCDPATNECSASIPCADHPECGDTAHCAEDGTCKQSSVGSPCGDENDCRLGHDCLDGFCACDGTTFQADQVPVNMLIVLDRSNSMQCHVEFFDDDEQDQIGYENENSRWQAALGAIDSLLASYDSSISFGLALYPTTDLSGPGNPDGALCDPNGTSGCSSDSAACTLGNRVVEIQANAGSQINAALADSQHAPIGCTPSGPSLQAQVGYDQLAVAGAENYVLHITDGVETCGGTDQVTAVENLRNQEPEVKTFVVGFTEGVDSGDLNAAAEAGGTARSGDLKYYQANDAATLEAALAEIGGIAQSCSFTLDSTPPNLDELYVYVGNQSIPRDTTHESGWDYDEAANRVTLYGGVCDAVKSGNDDNVTVVHGCPDIID